MDLEREDVIGRTHRLYVPPKKHLYSVETDPLWSESKLAKVAEYVEEIRIREARESFPKFMEYCFYDSTYHHPFRQQWFHDLWSAKWDTDNRVLIIAPRNSGKTSQIVGRAIWELGRNPNLRIKIACAADGRAKERLFEIKQNIELNERIKRVFPDLIPQVGAEWSKHNIVVKRSALHKDSSLEAIGISSTATGGRCDILIADDVVDRRNALEVPKLRQNIKVSWKSDWTNLLEPNSKIWYICTLWHKDDLSHELMNGSVFSVLNHSIEDDFGSIWPDKWPAEYLFDRYKEIGSIEFNRGFRNRVTDDSAKLVVVEDFKYTNVIPENLLYLCSYDTARGETTDFPACVIFGLDLNTHDIYVIDAWKEMIRTKEQARRVIADANRYSASHILIEKVGQCVLDEEVIDQYNEKRDEISVNVAEILETTTPRVNKIQRLQSVTPVIESRKLWFSSHLNPNAPDWTPGRENLVHELDDFPFGRNDDLVDAFSQGLDFLNRKYLRSWAGSRGVIEIHTGTSHQTYINSISDIL